MSPRRRSRRIAAVLASFVVTALATDARAETLTLAQAIEVGLQKSPAVRGAKSRTESADYGTSTARAGYFPTLSISAQAGYNDFLGKNAFLQRVPVPNPANPTQQQVDGAGRPVFRDVQGQSRTSIIGPELSNIGATVRWTVFDFGKTASQVGAADAAFKGATFGERETTAQTAGSIAIAYLTVFYQEKLFDLAKTTMESREKLFAIAKGLVKAGIQPPVEELRSQARLDGARRDHARAKAAFEDARLGLAMILGYDAGATLKVTTPRLAKVSADQGTVMKEAETKRPAVAAAAADADRARELADAASAAWFPTFQLLGSATYFHALPNDLDNPNQRRVLFGGAFMQWDLNFGLPARVDQAKADVAAAEESLEQQKRDAKTDAARAAIQVRMGQTQLEHAKRVEESTTAVRAVVEQRYIRGLSNPLELIDAEDSDIDAHVQRLLTELDYSSAIVRLCVLTGRPITDEAPGGSKADKSDKGDD